VWGGLIRIIRYSALQTDSISLLVIIIYAAGYYSKQQLLLAIVRFIFISLKHHNSMTKKGAMMKIT
jgi:hypothetical protein